MKGSFYVLGIDPGRASGWGLVRDDSPSPGVWIATGIAKTAADRASAIQTAKGMAEQDGVPLIVVGERWQGGWRKDRSSARTVSGIGAQWGRWQEALEAAGIPKRRILRVGQSTWRAKVIGGRVARTTEQWDHAMIMAARVFYGVEVTADEAAALLIARWGTRAAEVEAVLPKRRVSA